ncbi:MAG: hypothetical protein GYA62_02940 [Bacteroidales bacterium]|nr:hypothetical protein [Bacteroidales bacterium]
MGVLNKPDLIPGYDSSVVAGAQGWFSQNFFTKNLPQYIRGLLGNKTRLLWDSTPILQKYLVAFSWIGLLWGVCNKKTRYLSFSLVILILLPVIVIATFSTFDMRYIYHVIPTLLIGLVLFFLLVEKTSKKVKLRILFYGFVSILTLFYLWGNMARIKSQIVINLKYAETPWYYISVLKLNDYFSKEKITDGSKPVVISPMVPYYIDFYSNGNYQLLPLSVDQEFRLNKE